MQPGMLKRYGASILAFGHLSGMQHLHRRHKPRAVAKPITLEKPSMNAADWGVTFESNPELYRALHPVWDGRQKSIPVVNETEQSQTEPVRNMQQTSDKAEPAHSVQLPRANKQPATWTWEV